LSQVLDVPVAFLFDDMAEEIAGRPGVGRPDLNTLGSPDVVELVRADKFLAQGDLDGAGTWRRVLAAVKELENTEPRGAVH
jgi:hypothetical protein